ncbi:hypothetical protein HY404_03730 [Candidatus Microgenomates bacterium]|nr:hypothetical protein [Candidatus Microgenomates bacterium]
MVEIPHVLVGAAIAAKVGNPALALPLALASHFVLDMLPHWNPSIHSQLKSLGKVANPTKKLIAVESTLALIAGLLVATTVLPNYYHAVVVILGAFMGVLPDVVEIPYYFWGQRGGKLMLAYVNFNRSIQNDVPMLPGILVQILVSVAAIWWILI